MSAVRSNFLQLAFSAYQAHTNLWDGLLAGSHLLYYFQKVNIRKIGPGKGDGVFGGSSLGLHSRPHSPEHGMDYFGRNRLASA